jgi:integrase
MAKKPQVRYWSSRGTWTDAEGKHCVGGFYFTHQGRQHGIAGPDDYPDGPTYNGALKLLCDLTVLANADRAGDSNTVRVILERYLQHLADVRKAKEGTFKFRHQYYREFVAAGYGDMAIADLTHQHVYDYCRQREQGIGPSPETKKRIRRACTWNDGSRRNLISSLSVAFNWAVRNNLITRNPLVGIEKPEASSRSAACLINPEEHMAILENVSPAFRLLCIALENSGARPGELANATRAAWDDGRGAFVYKKKATRRKGEFSHKTSGKNRDRVVRFTGEALEMVRRLVVACTSDDEHVFKPKTMRNHKSRGKWVLQEIVTRFREARERLGLNAALTAYGYRHTFATKMLKRHMRPADLAALMGTSEKMIWQHYSHVAEDDAYLREQLERFMAESGSPSPQAPPAG